MKFRHDARALRVQWLGAATIVLAMLLAAAVLTAAQDEVYAAEAGGFVNVGGGLDPALMPPSDSLEQSRAESYVDLARSGPVARSVISELGLDVEPSSLTEQVSVRRPDGTVLILVTARGASPVEARALANAWVKALADEVRAIEDPDGIRRAGTVRVTPYSPAELPEGPVSPDPLRNLAIALVLGCVLAFGYVRWPRRLAPAARGPLPA